MQHKEATENAKSSAIASTTAVTSIEPLPKTGSLWYDYLHNCPLGCSISLHIDPEDKDVCMWLDKVGPDLWRVPPLLVDNADDHPISALDVLKSVREKMPEEHEIRVIHGGKPFEVKQEIVESGGEDHMRGLVFHSICGCIDLTNDSAQQAKSAANSDEQLAAAVEVDYETVMLSLGLPPTADADGSTKKLADDDGGGGGGGGEDGKNDGSTGGLGGGNDDCGGRGGGDNGDNGNDDNGAGGGGGDDGGGGGGTNGDNSNDDN
eukprot:1632123-Pleurochrysis_carterae.AAC.1